MDPGFFWFLPVWTVIVILRVYMSFGPTRRGWFFRAFPSRGREELAGLFTLATVFALMPVAGADAGQGYAWDWIPLIVVGCIGAGAAGLFGWQARRAHEPTWLTWKASLPARPDR